MEKTVYTRIPFLTSYYDSGVYICRCLLSAVLKLLSEPYVFVCPGGALFIAGSLYEDTIDCFGESP